MILVKAALAALLVFGAILIAPFLIGVITFVLCMLIFYVVFKNLEE
jgi:hypothetical protein